MNRRYTIIIRRSASRFYREARPVVKPTLRGAEREALAWLQTVRLTRDNGWAWDRWAVMCANSPHGVPRIVSYGDSHGVTFSAYRTGWRD